MYSSIIKVQQERILIKFLIHLNVPCDNVGETTLATINCIDFNVDPKQSARYFIY